MAILGPRYVKHQQATVSSAVKTLTDFSFSATEIASADRLLISVSSALRFTIDGSDPTTSKGLKIVANNWPIYELDGRQAAGLLKMIRDSAADAVVDITLIVD